MQIMGKLLDCFGDVSAAVRAANDALARAVMANLSNQGAVARLSVHCHSQSPTECLFVFSKQDFAPIQSRLTRECPNGVGLESCRRINLLLLLLMSRESKSSFFPPRAVRP